MEEVYEIHALRYGNNQNRTRQENFVETVDDHDSAMPLDYFVWLIRNENRAVVVDTGFDHIEARISKDIAVGADRARCFTSHIRARTTKRTRRMIDRINNPSAHLAPGVIER